MTSLAAAAEGSSRAPTSRSNASMLASLDSGSFRTVVMALLSHTGEHIARSRTEYCLHRLAECLTGTGQQRLRRYVPDAEQLADLLDAAALDIFPFQHIAV